MERTPSQFHVKLALKNGPVYNMPHGVCAVFHWQWPVTSSTHTTGQQRASNIANSCTHTWSLLYLSKILVSIGNILSLQAQHLREDCMYSLYLYDWASSINMVITIIVINIIISHTHTHTRTAFHYCLSAGSLGPHPKVAYIPEGVTSTTHLSLFQLLLSVVGFHHTGLVCCLCLNGLVRNKCLVCYKLHTGNHQLMGNKRWLLPN